MTANIEVEERYDANQPRKEKADLLTNLKVIDITPFVGPSLMRVGGCGHAAAA